MKLIRTGLISLFALLASAQSAFAQNTVNGQQISFNSEMNDLFWAVPVGVAILAIGIFGFIFWLWMLIDAIKNEKEDKTMWVVLIILLNLLGAIIYYFVKKRKGAKA